MLAKKYRLTKTKDFHCVYKQKKFFNGPLFSAKYVKNNLKISRAAVIISKKTFNKAIDRNRQKRRVHAVLQIYWSQLKTNIDLVLFLKKKIKQSSYQDITAEIKRFLSFNKLI